MMIPCWMRSLVIEVILLALQAAPEALNRRPLQAPPTEALSPKLLSLFLLIGSMPLLALHTPAAVVYIGRDGPMD